jgi:hypothetical protein
VTRCCLCRVNPAETYRDVLEPTDLPGGWRCLDRHACSDRIRSLIDAHKAFADICDDVS